LKNLGIEEFLSYIWNPSRVDEDVRHSESVLGTTSKNGGQIALLPRTKVAEDFSLVMPEAVA
jgi:hypothetical protein